MAVNVSAVQLNRSDFSDGVESALEEVMLPGRLLELELTESALMANFDKTIREVSKLRSLGVSVVIDDFGVGYSSLSYLKELPVSGVKLDRSFCEPAAQSEYAADFAKHCGVGARLKDESDRRRSGDSHELDEIRKLGVDAGQGYLLGKPELRAGEAKTAHTGA